MTAVTDKLRALAALLVPGAPYSPEGNRHDHARTGIEILEYDSEIAYSMDGEREQAVCTVVNALPEIVAVLEACDHQPMCHRIGLNPGEDLGLECICGLSAALAALEAHFAE